MGSGVQVSCLTNLLALQPGRNSRSATAPAAVATSPMQIHTAHCRSRIQSCTNSVLSVFYCGLSGVVARTRNLRHRRHRRRALCLLGLPVFVRLARHRFTQLFAVLRGCGYCGQTWLHGWPLVESNTDGGELRVEHALYIGDERVSVGGGRAHLKLDSVLIVLVLTHLSLSSSWYVSRTMACRRGCAVARLHPPAPGATHPRRPTRRCTEPAQPCRCPRAAGPPQVHARPSP